MGPEKRLGGRVVRLRVEDRKRERQTKRVLWERVYRSAEHKISCEKDWWVEESLRRGLVEIM